MKPSLVPISFSGVTHSLKRTAQGLGANAYGQLVALSVQLVGLPAFLIYWSLAQYGHWIILYTAPAYFAMADFGIVTAAANQMTMSSANGDLQGSVKRFQNALLAVGTLTSSVGLLSVIVVFALPDSLVNSSDRVTLLALIFTALITVFGGLFDAVFRANDRYPTGTFLSNTSRLIDWAGGMVALALIHTEISVAIGMLLSRFITSSLTGIYLIKRYPTYRWSLNGATRKEAMALSAPGIGFLLLPIGNVLSLQGMTLLVGSLLGPTAVATFSAYRTLTRCLVQLIAIISKSVWPEITRLYAKGAMSQLRRLYNISAYGTVGLSVITSLIVWALAPYILSIWTHGKIAYDSRLLILFLTGSVLTSFWQIGMVLLAATNNHERFAIYYLMASGLSLIPPLFVFQYGLTSIALCSILLELSLIVITKFFIRNIVGDSKYAAQPNS